MMGNPEGNQRANVQSLLAVGLGAARPGTTGLTTEVARSRRPHSVRAAHARATTLG
jgi:hypothetical protein